MMRNNNQANRQGGNRVIIPYEKMSDGPSWFSIILFVIIPVWPVAIYLGLQKLSAYWKKKKMADYRNYATIIGKRSEVDVRDISVKLGKTTSLVFSDLQVMIDKGYMGPNAYLDHSRGMLVFDVADADGEEGYTYEPAERRTDAQAEAFAGNSREEAPKTGQEVRREPVRETSKASARKPENVKTANGWREDEYEKCLREIREINEGIEDAEVSHRIDRIGELAAGIFSFVRQRPESEAEVRKFMSYYLPTTFKLLKSYSLMEKQSYQGENITASRKKIENILDTLIGAFEKQQDRLFHTDAMDVDADIRVLETMLAKDGLSDSVLDLRAMAEAQGIKLGAGES